MTDYETRKAVSECHTKKYINNIIHNWGKQAELRVWQECRETIQELTTALNDNPEQPINELINERINEPRLNGRLRTKTLELVKQYLIKKRYLKDVSLIEQ